MRHTLTVAAREMREYWFLFVFAAVLALVPFSAMFIRSSGQSGRMEMVAILGLVIAANFAIVVAMMLGATTVGRDLGDRRLSFYYSRPLGSGAIWFGKLIAAVLATLLAFAVIAIPAGLAAPRAWQSTWPISLSASVGVAAAAGLLIVLLAHAASTIVRSRSPLAILDLVLLAGAVGVSTGLVRVLLANGAFRLALITAGSLTFAAALILIAGGAWQLARGRTDARQNHLELSKFVWIATAALLVIAGSYVAWVFSATPKDLRIETVEQSPRGDWMVVSGRSSGRGDFNQSFLVNTATGDYQRFPSIRWARASFTRQGDAAYAFPPFQDRRSGDGAAAHLQIVRLDAKARRILTSIPAAKWWVPVILSDDLQHAAVISNGVLSVYDVEDSRLVGSARIAGVDEGGARMYFVSHDVVRLYVSSGDNQEGRPAELQILEFDAAHRRLSKVGSVSAAARSLRAVVTADGSRLLVVPFSKRADNGAILADARTGARVPAPALEDVPTQRAFLLADGRVAAIARTAGGDTLRLIRPDGTLEREIPTGTHLTRVTLEEMGGGKRVLLSIYEGDPRTSVPRLWSTVVVNFEEGRVERHQKDIHPDLRSHLSYWATDPRLPVPNASGEYFAMAGGPQPGLVLWNALTGRTRPLLWR